VESTPSNKVGHLTLAAYKHSNKKTRICYPISQQINREVFRERGKEDLDSRARALSAAIAENSVEVQGIQIPHFFFLQFFVEDKVTYYIFGDFD
jgi:hypothetical protein